GIGNERDPFLARQHLAAVATIGAAAKAAAPEEEGSRVARVVQDLESPGEGEGCPGQLSFVQPAADPAWEEELALVELLEGGPGRAGPPERVEQVANRLLDLGVGVEDDPARRVVAQPDRQRPGQLAPAGLGEDSSPKPCLEDVELRFAHRALQAEEETIVERGGL